MVKPGNLSFLGGGLFADMFKDATAMVRDYISQNSEEWEQIINAPDFRKYFSVRGTALKDAELMDAEAFLAKAAELFRLMKPFNDYLNKALAEFQMPTR